MTQTLELLDKGLKAVVFKMLQQAMTNTLETNKQKALAKKQKIRRSIKRKY